MIMEKLFVASLDAALIRRTKVPVTEASKKIFSQR